MIFTQYHCRLGRNPNICWADLFYTQDSPNDPFREIMYLLSILRKMMQGMILLLFKYVVNVVPTNFCFKIISGVELQCQWSGMLEVEFTLNFFAEVDEWN